MIFGIGTDIVEIDRIAKVIARHGERFTEYILTESEIAEAARRGDRISYIAGRWAAKESVAKSLGCGLGAKLCRFTGKESLQVGVGMVCRGEVALIVANRGLELGVLSADMMAPVIITVVGGTILTPILLKLVFRNDGQADSPAEGGLVDRYDKMEQLEEMRNQLRIVLARGCCKNISRQEVHNLVDEIFDDYE